MKTKYWDLIIGVILIIILAIFRWFISDESFEVFLKPFNHWFPMVCYGWGSYFLGIYSGKTTEEKTKL